MKIAVLFWVPIQLDPASVCRLYTDGTIYASWQMQKNRCIINKQQLPTGIFLRFCVLALSSLFLHCVDKTVRLSARPN